MDELIEATAATERVLTEWEFDIPLVGNPSLIRTLMLAFGVPIGLICLFLVIKGLLVAALVMGVGLVLLFAVGFLISAAVLGNAYHATFQLTTGGVRLRGESAERAIADPVVAAGARPVSASTARAGLLARAEQDLFIAWEDVASVEVSAERQTVRVGRGSRLKPIELYCTAANFDEVLTMVRDRSPATAWR